MAANQSDGMHVDSMLSTSDSLSNVTFIHDDAISGLISDGAMQYVYTINCAIVSPVVCLFGIVANIINIMVFIKMRFKETTNIALLSLAISDLISLLFLLWNNICFNPLVMYANIPIYTFELQQKTASFPHVIFMRVTAFITVYITFERCLCIMFPLKIKQILTPKRVFIIIVCIYVVTIACLSPNLATVRLTWKFIPKRNRSMYGFVYTENRYSIQIFTYYANVILLMLAFISVIACSSVLIWKLNQRGKWLSETTKSSQDNSKASRDGQVIKMVTIVAVIFIVSFTPSVLSFWGMAVEPELNLGKRYENMFFMIVSTMFLCDAINSSVNIFVYYKMSSKYQQTFRKLFNMKSGNIA